ncbi:cell division control protein 6 homolog [Diabrotica virgifera virgifera]|uniref:Cell division control protein n=1 Tax=Diabrotica virgifera virgifera TaxID=50390 RepID=A0A6P7FGQ8_DIAVI|nr:cell division control protein 6 homolog [Diabrotica virgifera virgifera]
MNTRSSARLCSKNRGQSFRDLQKFSKYSSDSSSDDDSDLYYESISTPRKTKSKAKYEDSGTPPKQKKIEARTPNNKSTVRSTTNTPSLQRLAITSPKKPKSTRKTLFKENDTTKKTTENKKIERILTNSDSECTSDDEESSTDIPKNRNAYQSARQALHGTAPTEMPGREKELKDLREFIDRHIKDQISGSLYVSGPPGTGKTASLNIILKEKKLMSGVSHVYVNCTAIKSPTAIYSRICKELNIKVDGKSEKEHLLQIVKYLKKKHKTILLVLDEIDQLESKNQSILYTIFEWPSKPNAHILLIGIANALDLTDRILPRLQARCELKPTLMHFAPYTKPQIIEIFTSRLRAANVLDIFSPAAVQMLAGKVAAVSGDIRRALDIGRRVVELAERSKKTGALKSVENLANQLVDEETKTVDLKQVLTVLNSVYGTSQNLDDNTEDSFPLQQKIIICSLLLMLKKNKSKDVTIGKLHEVYCRVCKKRKIGSVDQTELVGLCALIESKGIITVSGKKEPRLNKVSMVWDQDEVTNALKDKQLISDILKDESCLGKF